MRILKCALIALILSVSFMQYIAIAQDGAGERRGRLRAFLKKRQSQREVSSITKKLDISYSSDADPLKKLDVYIPEKGTFKFPVLIHIHGGGWKMGDKSRTEEHGRFYATRGILFVSINYRLSPDVQHPVHAQDCADAVAWVFAHLDELGGDENRVFISGHSAGAHLAALLAIDSGYLQQYGLQPKKFAGVIPVDTASFDLIAASNEKLVKRFIEEAFGTDPEVLKSASPLYNISKDSVYPKFLIFASGNREPAIAQSKELTNALKSAGGSAHLLIVKNHTHRDMNMGMYNADDPVGSAILKFILGTDSL
ncbi:MAG: alpha/beta hydrolase [Candidatus Omnitrophota bacterium]|nr:alpha/beta hydrolase [Candidatus Omnitrophota bacterium]